MIKSMTGFGKGEATAKNRRFLVELRSVNSKQLDLSIKTPGRYRAAEHEIRSIINRTIKRGKVDCFVTIENATSENLNHINQELFQLYVNQLQEAALKSGLDTSSPGWSGFLMQSVIRLPEVVSCEEQRVSDEELQAIIEATEIATRQLNEFREKEGGILIADLLERVRKIEEYKLAVEPYEKGRVNTIKERIREHIQEIGIPVDANRLEQEMIFYVEKLDITEEKVRLKQHCDYFREVASTEEEPGRKLGFIAQEMGREINTLGSKSNEANMQILVVKMKDELEKIKEQVLNIL